MATVAVINPIPQFFDIDGDPLDNGKLYFGVINQNPITSPTTVAWDEAGAVPAAQPVRTKNGYPYRAGKPAIVYCATNFSLLVLNKRGEMVFYAPNSAEFGNVESLRSDLANKTDPLKGPALVGIGPLNYPTETVGGAIFTTVWGDGVSDRAAQLASANSLGFPIRIKGILHLASPVTINVPILDTMSQIFTAVSPITIDNNLPVRPEWWGMTAGNIRRAIDSLPAAGGIVQLASRIYPPSYDTALPAYFNNRGGTPGVDYMVKKHVRIQGARLPEFNSTNTQLENGTIIQGAFYVASECDGFQIDLVGVDAGINVINSLYGGADHDALCILQANKTTPYYGKGIHVGRVVGLCSGAASLAHACLFEAIDGGTIEYAEGRQANHGVVIKSKNIVAGKLIGRQNRGEDVILKSDYYATLENVEVAQVVCDGSTPGPDPGYGLLILADAASGGNIQIGSVQVDRKNYGIHFQANGAFLLTDVHIAQATVRSCPLGIKWQNVNTLRCRLGKAFILACPSGLIADGTAQDINNGVDDLTVVNSTFSVDATGKISVGQSHIQDSTWGYYHRANSARIFLGGGHTGLNLVNFWAAQPPLVNSWATVGANDPFKLLMRDGEVIMSGLIGSGAATTICTVPVPICPPAALRFPCLAYNGATFATVEVLITPAGVVSVSSLAAASSYLSLSGIRWPIPT